MSIQTRYDLNSLFLLVLLIARNAKPTLFLKSSPVTSCDDLADDAKRLESLQGRLPVPAVLAYVVHDEHRYLLTTGLPGVNGVEAGCQDPGAVATGVGQALAELHSQSILECPFDETRHARTQRAYARIQNGCVDEADFDEERRGMGWLQPFFEAYGLYEPAHRKLGFYRLLDEFFLLGRELRGESQ